ncbi:unnamed protein product [Cylindrotheca closterium]|uniref:DNA helicase n=1 Tax=Cylindrotheca closterium TaxID=2856 RepID=A0AAD2JJH2_9STRA|nr:unnamed protein product [Cylindrotheca closterium]
MIPRPRPYDSIECAPTGRSTCRICKKKIAKGAARAGIHSLHKRIYWNRYFYHKECVKTTSVGISLWKQAKLPPNLLLRQKGGHDLSRMSLLDLGEAKIEKQKRVSDSTIRERSDLREKLRRLRFGIAQRLNYEPYMVFPNSTLDALVLHLPSNREELLKISGFAAKRTETLGPFVLPIIRDYKKKLTTTDSSSNSDKARAAVPCLEEEEEEVTVEREVSGEEIINRLFEEAYEKGVVITL